jgi:hypothetical protein
MSNRAVLCAALLLVAVVGCSESPTGRGFDIQGIKLGTTIDNLPANFRNIPSSPQGFLTAVAYKKCETKDQCTEIRIDNTVTPPRVYAVLATNVSLGRLQYPETAVTLLTDKYGQPASRGGGFMMMTAILSWGTASDFANLGAPEAVDRLLDARPRMSPDGPEVNFSDFMVAIIGVDNYGNYSASLWLVDARSARRVRDRSAQMLADLKNQQLKRELESAPKPKF